MVLHSKVEGSRRQDAMRLKAKIANALFSVRSQRKQSGVRMRLTGHVGHGVKPPNLSTTSADYLPPSSLFHYLGWRTDTMIVGLSRRRCPTFWNTQQTLFSSLKNRHRIPIVGVRLRLTANLRSKRNPDVVAQHFGILNKPYFLPQKSASYPNCWGSPSAHRQPT